MADPVDTVLRTYPSSPVILDIFGTLDADTIRDVARKAEPELEEIFFFAASVGALFGVRRRDGTRVALKVHTLFRDEQYFDDMQVVQAALADAGFPAPRPLGRSGLVTREEWLDTGEFRDAHEPEVRTAMTRELVRFVELATASPARPRRPFLRPAGALWPKPHNALFDFEKTAAGAEWIDEIGAAARAITDRGVGREVVGHSDFSVKHLRFDPDLNATALYDWDSVNTDLEPVVVGTAAGSFTYTEELAHEIVVWPTLEESRAFLADYELARGAPFSDEERTAARAACVYLRAYGQRCGHAVGGIRDTGLVELAEAML